MRRWAFLCLLLVVVATPARTGAESVLRSPDALSRELAGLDRELFAACRWAQARPDEALRQRAESLWQQRARIVGRAGRVSQLPPSCRQRLARVMEPQPSAGRKGSRGGGGTAYRYQRSAPKTASRPVEVTVPPPSLAPPPPPPNVGSPAPAPDPVRRPAAAYGSTPSRASPPLPDMFPWPPPTPSTRRSFSPDVVADAPAARILGETATRLEGLLRQADFDSWGYFRAPNGFALVTRVERLDGNTGLALAGDARCSDRTASASILPGATRRVIFLTSRPTGYYRVMVFIATDDPPMTRPTGEQRPSRSPTGGPCWDDLAPSRRRSAAGDRQSRTDPAHLRV